MTETNCLDGLKVTFEADISPDRTPEACTVARNDCDTILEDIDRKSLRLGSDLFLEICCAIYFA